MGDVWLLVLRDLAHISMHTLLSFLPGRNDQADTSAVQVQNRYSEPFIIVLSYAREQQINILTSDQVDYYMDYMSSLATAIDQQAIANTHLLQLDGNGLPTSNWCAGHPNAAAHRFIAGQVLSCLERTFPEWGNSTFPPQ